MTSPTEPPDWLIAGPPSQTPAPVPSTVPPTAPSADDATAASIPIPAMPAPSIPITPGPSTVPSLERQPTVLLGNALTVLPSSTTDGGVGAAAGTPARPTPPAAGGGPGAPPPKTKSVVCPVCSTTFAWRATAGRCPVCGEQVVQVDAAASAVPVVGPLWSWLTREGNWRLLAVAALVLYQLVLFIALWIHLAQIHAL